MLSDHVQLRGTNRHVDLRRGAGSRFELAMLSKRKLLTVTRSGDVLILKRNARELEQSMLNIEESVEG